MLEITIWDIQKNTFIVKEIMFTGIPRRAQALGLALKVLCRPMQRPVNVNPP